MSGVRFPEGKRDLSRPHRVQTGYGAHPVSYPMGTAGSLPGGGGIKARDMKQTLHFPIRLHGIVLY
jgi:hypothetical protein